MNVHVVRTSTFSVLRFVFVVLGFVFVVLGFGFAVPGFAVPDARLGAQEAQVIIGGGAAGAAEIPPDVPTEFEVASVKPNNSGTNNIRFGLQPGGRFIAVNAPLRELLRFAYAVQNFQLVDVPDWAQEERFDIQATAGVEVPPSQPGTVGPIQRMVQALLAERFQLQAHEDTREMPIYALVLNRDDGRLGPQLQPSVTDCAALMAAARRGGPPPAPPAPGERPQCGMFGGIGQIRAGSVTMPQLARMLAGQVQRVVVDRTGLEGSFDFDLAFTPDRMPQGPPPPGAPLLPAVDPDGVSIFTALQEQLGLKLDAQRGPVTVLVVDRVERPTPD